MNSIDALPNWNRLSAKQRLLILRQEKVRRVSTRRFDLFYPETGPIRRDLYQKHLEFFRAGARYRERCFMAANRVGKTEGAGGYEIACHVERHQEDRRRNRHDPRRLARQADLEAGRARPGRRRRWA